MKRVLSPILGTLLFIFLLAAIAFPIFMRKVARGFVHGEPGNEAYYRPAADRVVFPVRGNGEVFDNALIHFMTDHPEYTVPEDIQEQISKTPCNCLAFHRYIFFVKEPREIYLTTYDYNAGVVDRVFRQKDRIWTSVPTAELDSTEKVRIRNRLITEIIDSLPANTHF